MEPRASIKRRDYTYLHLLREAITARRGAPAMAGTVADAERVLETAVQTVLDDPQQTELAGRQREMVIEALVMLSAPPP